MKPFLLLFVTLSFSVLCRADGFAYHGSLREVNGDAFNKTLWNTRSSDERTFTFSLYTSAAGSEEPVWSVTFSGDTGVVSPDADGNFTVSLDNGTNLNGDPLTFFEAVSAHTTTSLYLGITVGKNTAELSPRQELISVPYAAHADLVEGGALSFSAEQAVTVGKEFSVTGKVKLDQLTSLSTELRGKCNVHGAATAVSLTAAGENSFMGDVTAETISGCGTIPVGGIIPFFGEAIPEGWALCNGENGTPDLTDHFILGARPEMTAGATGGAASFTLREENLPAHTHTHTRTLYGELHNYVCVHKSDKSNRWRYTTPMNSNSNDGFDASGNLLKATPESFPTLPPYLLMRFIMRTK